MKPSTPAALLNLEDALDLIQEAQRLLDQACQKLSPIRRGMDLSDKTFAMREKVHKHWYLVAKARKRAGMSLDSEGL